MRESLVVLPRHPRLGEKILMLLHADKFRGEVRQAGGKVSR